MTTSAEARAEQSKGSSSDAILRMVRDILLKEFPNPEKSNLTLLDVGCGKGNLWPFVQDLVKSYEGVDILRYEGFPAECVFHHLNLDSGRAALADGYADVVAAVETIEHLENPRAFVRELSRLCKPGGMVIVTTPNQLSLLSKLTLVLKNRFSAFADSCYPAHITALLEIDLIRIANECGFAEVKMHYTCEGRIPGTAWHFPNVASRWAPRALSDNLGMVGKKS
jgi:2-polyprenyl-3-methyl-5-hydroxy-6-metoxy-1,4-benzoquinol methylase